MIRRLLTVALALMLVFSFAAVTGAQTKRISIATAGTAGALYPMGVAMALVINKHTKGPRASAEASAGSIANLRNLAGGEVEMGISQNEMAFLAYGGKGKFAGRAIPQLRSLFGNLTSWVQIFVPADSPIKSLADLRGKRVGVGAPGSGGEQTARMILASAGLDYKSVTAEFMSNTDMVAALKDGSLDAFFITHPLRSAPLRDLAASRPVRLLPVDDADFYAQRPYYARRMVPVGTYSGQKTAVPTATSRIVMYTTTKSGLSDAQVYEILKALWDHVDEWASSHPAVKRTTKLSEVLTGLAVPLHPAAARFYAERGLKVPARLIAK